MSGKCPYVTPWGNVSNICATLSKILMHPLRLTLYGRLNIITGRQYITFLSLPWNSAAASSPSSWTTEPLTAQLAPMEARPPLSLPTCCLQLVLFLICLQQTLRLFDCEYIMFISFHFISKPFVQSLIARDFQHYPY